MPTMTHPHTNRRAFLQGLSTSGALLALGGCKTPSGAGHTTVMTVRGPVPAQDIGFTLTHEHLLASFQPYAEWARAPLVYDPDEVVRVMLPHLQRIASLGCKTFVDATAVGLGRDPVVIRRLAEASGLNILMTTGNYAAIDFRQLPPYVFDDSEQRLAARWVSEFHDGIEGSGVRPGFIKLGFNGRPLADVERKMIRAGAIAHRATGLTIGAHTGPAVAAFEQLAELDSLGVAPDAWIWIHSQNEPDVTRHEEAARRGAWISLDHVSPATIADHVERVARLRDAGFLGRVLVSQDAGWYSIGRPNGGTVRPFDTVFTEFIPALENRGFTAAEIRTIFVDNPARAFGIRKRLARGS